MQIVRRYRRVILLVLSLFALTAMTYGTLRRFGCDPLRREAPEDAP